MVGGAILRRLQAQGTHDCITRKSADLDLTDQAAVRDFMQDEKPDEVAEAADFNEEEGEVDFHALHTLVLMDGKKESSGMDGHGHGKRVHRRNSRY